MTVELRLTTGGTIVEIMCIFLFWCWYLQHLRQELEQKFYEERFDWEQVRHNDAAGLLKMFIRELPYPLLTLQHAPAFSAAQSEYAHARRPTYTLMMKWIQYICD